jgi:hypothetical protein
MGSVGEKVTSSTLMVVTPEKYELVKGYVIRIWCDKEGYIQAMYKNPWTGEAYNSSKDVYYKRNGVKFY